MDHRPSFRKKKLKVYRKVQNYIHLFNELFTYVEGNREAGEIQRFRQLSRTAAHNAAEEDKGKCEQDTDGPNQVPRLALSVSVTEGKFRFTCTDRPYQLK